MNEHNTPTTETALREAALEYHRLPTRGKISVTPTKPLANQRDLSLAYSPGRGLRLPGDREGPALAAEYTARGNLVGVITNGTAVLGLGDIGPLAAKPVMEGKACLFKKFAGIDVFDIELAEKRPRQAGRASSPRSSPRWAASTSRTSRRPSASTSRRSCASA
jgi:malate dehydrogenase (oxaloacetate-decarboxylating)(NADP+)